MKSDSLNSTSKSGFKKYSKGMSDPGDIANSPNEH